MPQAHLPAPRKLERKSRSLAAGIRAALLLEIKATEKLLAQKDLCAWMDAARTKKTQLDIRA